MAKEITVYKDKPLLKNSIIERKFLRLAKERQIRVFMGLLSDGTTARATSYASKIVERWIDHWIEQDLRNGVDLEFVAFKLFKQENEE